MLLLFPSSRESVANEWNDSIIEKKEGETNYTYTPGEPLYRESQTTVNFSSTWEGRDVD